MTKIIKCAKCDQYLGEIRDATLRKGAVFMCGTCQHDKHRSYSPRQKDSIFDNIFGDKR